MAPRDRQFAHKKPWPKFLTLFAGPLFNFILALVLFIGLAYYQGTPTSTVEQVDKYPAQQAGLQKGDKIVQIGTENI
ncbi:site-2 protease family protein [Staphylococcus aureus]